MSKRSRKEFNGTDRFSIQRRLGSGGFGVVYEVYDREQNSLVALKTLHSTDAGALYRFKQEFRVLADVTHPNLVALYELMSDGDQWFFTMELVEGVDFIRFVEGIEPNGVVSPEGQMAKAPSTVDVKPTTRDGAETLRITDKKEKSPATLPSPDPSPTKFSPSLNRLRKALRQLAEGVFALHESGRLHRDIKPSNVLVTSEDRLVILDFGLVTELAPQGFYQSLEITGTPAYMSPEQGAGLPVSEATDWYSVGIILYEALTGKLPFTGRPLDVLMAKQRFDPLPPNEVVPEIPEDLNSLCMDLLNRDPELRPSGREVLRRLGVDESTALQSILWPALRAVPLIGRERHLGALRAAFQAAKKGRAVTVYVYGRSGIGKSALIRKFLDDLRQDEPDVVILTGRCYEQESVPYKALDSLVDALSQYLRRLPSLEAEAFMPRDVLALAKLFPVLLQVEVVAGAKRKVLEIPDSQELQRRAFAALRELLARLADRKLLVLFIDDLQWGDVDSAALLGELLRPPDPPTLLLIGSYRSEEAETSPFLKILLPSQATTTSAVEVQKVSVGELSSSEAKELAMVLLGEKQGSSLAHAEVIARESGGSPFFIDELVRYSQMDNGSARERDESSKAKETKLEDVIQARVSQLPDEARRLLEVVAVAGQPLERVVAKQAAELDTDEYKILSLLRTSHLIRATGASEEKFETYHDRIRETVVVSLASETLKAHHHCLALALEDSGKADPEKLAVHFQQAGDCEKAAEYAVVAAEKAAEALAFNRAARLYRLALELRQMEAQEARTLRVKLGDALANAGRGVEAARAYLDAVEGEKDVETLELQRRAAEQFLFSNHTEEGLAVLRTVLDAVGMKIAKTPRGAVLSYLLQRAKILLRGLNYRERDVSQISAEELFRIDVCWSVAMGFAVVDPIRGADFQARHLLLALRAGEPYRIARALALEAGYSSASGGHTRLRTEKLLQMAMALAERLDNPNALGFVTLQIGAVAFFEGNCKKAVEMCKRALEILRERCTGVSREIDNAENSILGSLLYLGEMKELSYRLSSLVKSVRERGDLYAATFIRTRLSAITCLMADQVNEARQELRQAIKQWSYKEFHVHHYHNFITQVEIALYCGDGLSAWNCINEYWPAFTRSLLQRAQCVLIESLHMRARAALAAALNAGDPKPLLLTAERDAKRIEREKMHWGDPLALLIRAAVAAFRGNMKDAAALLSSAESGFEAADMALYAAASRRRRGELIGGDDGRALVEAADDWMANQKIENPLRMAAMLAPGKWKK